MAPTGGLAVHGGAFVVRTQTGTVKLLVPPEREMKLNSGYIRCNNTSRWDRRSIGFWYAGRWGHDGAAVTIGQHGEGGRENGLTPGFPMLACHNGFSRALLRSSGCPALGLEAEILRHTVLVLLHLQPGREARSWALWHKARHSRAGG